MAELASICPGDASGSESLAREFRQENLVTIVAGILKDTGLEPSLLELEITESIAMQNVEFTKRLLDELKEMGIKIAIDDFGTGYSSLSYLTRFPIDSVKIDRSFIKEILNDRRTSSHRFRHHCFGA